MKTKFEAVDMIIDNKINRMLEESKIDFRVFKATDLVRTSLEKYDIIEKVLKGKQELIKQIKDLIDKNKKKEIKNTAFS